MPQAEQSHLLCQAGRDSRRLPGRSRCCLQCCPWLTAPGGANESERHLHPPPDSTLPPSLPQQAAPPWRLFIPSHENPLICLPKPGCSRRVWLPTGHAGLQLSTGCHRAGWLWVCSPLALFQIPNGDLQGHPPQQHLLAPKLGKANPMRYREGESLVPRVFAENDADEHK